MKVQTAVILTVALGASAVVGVLLFVRPSEPVATEFAASEQVVPTAADPRAEKLQNPEQLGIDAAERQPSSRTPIARPLRTHGVTPPLIDPHSPLVEPTPADPLRLPETTVEQMITKRNAIDHAVNERCKPLLSKKFDDHLAVRVCDGLSYTTTAFDSHELYAVRMIPGEGTFRASLSRFESPDLYFMRDEKARLDETITARAPWGDSEPSLEVEVASPR